MILETLPPLAHAGDVHASQLLVLLGMGVGPAVVILIALLFAGSRKDG